MWGYSTDLDALQRNILAAVEARRRLSGLNDLMTYFKDPVRRRLASLSIRTVIMTYFKEPVDTCTCAHARAQNTCRIRWQCARARARGARACAMTHLASSRYAAAMMRC